MSDFSGIPKIMREAAKILLSAENIDRSIHAKAGEQNFVTDYDVRTENMLREAFAKLLPEADMLGEESADTHQIRIAEGLTLIVDPIDGTTNFIHGCRYSAISVGVCDRGKMVYGAIYDPYMDELFRAEAGKGAFVEDRGVLTPIKVSSRKLEDSLTYFGTAPYYRDTLCRPTFTLLEKLFHITRDIRRSGSAAMDLTSIACGRGDIFFEYRLSPWDYAAGSLLITEAGGEITQLDGSPLRFDAPCSVLAGNPVALAEFRAGNYLE
ncbi:MAG: inositol monophosphatase [Clostridia bacterium]|nr:inositol monophosphatase [Clostridia bacterium]